MATLNTPMSMSTSTLKNFRKIDGRWYADLGALTVTLGDDDEKVARILRDEPRVREQIDDAIERGDRDLALTLCKALRALLAA